MQTVLWACRQFFCNTPEFSRHCLKNPNSRIFSAEQGMQDHRLRAGASFSWCHENDHLIPEYTKDYVTLNQFVA